tara:strand:+ start:569 stop:763 length:195 start_codon:yes stop_codon:yes gene_type:complete
MPQKIIQKDSPFDKLGEMLETQTNRGMVLGLKTALVALKQQEIEILSKIKEYERLLDEVKAQNK